MEDVTHHPGSLVGMVGAWQKLFDCLYLIVTRIGNLFCHPNAHVQEW
jgi:hypothetical protein